LRSASTLGRGKTAFATQIAQCIPLFWLLPSAACAAWWGCHPTQVLFVTPSAPLPQLARHNRVVTTTVGYVHLTVAFHLLW
jgi:hypothetical protein